MQAAPSQPEQEPAEQHAEHEGDRQSRSHHREKHDNESSTGPLRSEMRAARERDRVIELERRGKPAHRLALIAEAAGRG